MKQKTGAKNTSKFDIKFCRKLLYNILNFINFYNLIIVYYMNTITKKENIIFNKKLNQFVIKINKN